MDTIEPGPIEGTMRDRAPPSMADFNATTLRPPGERCAARAKSGAPRGVLQIALAEQIDLQRVVDGHEPFDGGQGVAVENLVASDVSQRRIRAYPVVQPGRARGEGGAVHGALVQGAALRQQHRRVGDQSRMDPEPAMASELPGNGRGNLSHAHLEQATIADVRGQMPPDGIGS